MRAFFDTSVLVPVFYADHIHHQASIELFAAQSPRSGCCGAHSLAEVYATLTAMPGARRISGPQALLFVGSIQERLSVVALETAEYIAALQAAAANGLAGGAIYDALLAQCAIKAGADVIYTWNLRHFALCGPSVTAKLRRP